jgi:hypothetical protein
MKKLRWIAALAVLAGTLSSCIVHTGPRCHTDCWWDHGRRVCERRCN